MLRVGDELTEADVDTGTPPIDYDRDPAAIAWARAKLERTIEQIRGYQRLAIEKGDLELARMWDHRARWIQWNVLGDGTGYAITPFDPRHPQVRAILDGAEERLQDQLCPDTREDIEHRLQLGGLR